MITSVTVTDLITYPVKSCAGIALLEANVTPRGLHLDRDFMVVDDEGTFVSQRTVPQLALVTPSLRAVSFALTAPGMEPIEVPYELGEGVHPRIDCTVHGREVVGQLAGEAFDEWFTSFLPRYKQNRRFRLVRVCEDAPRFIKDRYQLEQATNQVGFADGNSMLLANERSLAQLNTLLEDPVPMNRFRPNIVVNGPDLGPYEEDSWSQLEIGPMTAFVVKACDRCPVPDTDQKTAVVGKAVRRALVSRKGANAFDPTNKGVFFAQNLNHVWAPGLTLRVGDDIRVIERLDHPNVVLSARS